MARVAKRETILQQTREESLFMKRRLEGEIDRIKRENKKDILFLSILWMFALGIALFFIFPIGFILGWFVGRELLLRKLCGDRRNQLKNLGKHIKLQPGEEGESKVSDVIEGWLPDSFTLMNDLVVPNGRNGTQIDHVLIGPEKIYCIETKDITGRFYPHRDGWLWYPYNSRGKVIKKTIVKSPQGQSIYHANHLRKYLRRNGYYFQVEPVVIMTNSRGVWMGKQDAKCPIFRIQDFVHYVKKENKGKITREKSEELASLLLECDRDYSDGFYAAIR
ncbi:nuclease-related domain-containing protein [Alkalihalobacillus sp. CinArs1]|uniref:nuclease-related domain-containing protein n=1 Tax=Alkalihalobacillus sp. CinArs1 TaxID=2995314 RepID=UPI0022DE0B72|nr:nuclease-related domain-containing protein [Alkalihalobacillus sp. CinArs1]